MGGVKSLFQFHQLFLMYLLLFFPQNYFRSLLKSIFGRGENTKNEKLSVESKWKIENFKKILKKSELKCFTVKSINCFLPKSGEIIESFRGLCQLFTISLKNFYLFKIAESVINFRFKKFSNQQF